MSSTADTYYETYWSEDGFLPHGKAWPALEQLYETQIPSASRVLDVGCGDSGTSGPALKRLGHHYVGADISSTAVARSTASGFDARVVAGADDLGFDDRSFDAVVCIEVVEHLFDPISAVREMHRVLRPGGTLIVTTPNVAYWRHRVDIALLGRFNPRGDDLAVSQPWRDPHIRFFNPRSLNDMLISGGFGSVEMHGQEGGVLNGLPFISTRRSSKARSRLYEGLEQKFPSILAYRLAAVAKRH